MPARSNFSPRSGPLAGQRFATEYQYQTALARHYGYASYAEQRVAKASPEFRRLEANTRAQFGGKYPRSERAKNLSVFARLWKPKKRPLSPKRPQDDRERLIRLWAKRYDWGLSRYLRYSRQRGQTPNLPLFDTLFFDAARSNWDTSSTGPYHHWLVLLGLRGQHDYWQIGDSGKLRYGDDERDTDSGDE